MDANKKYQEKLAGTYTKLVPAVLNKTWKQHPTKQQRYSYLPQIS